MKIYIIGSGGHCGVLIDACNRLNYHIEGLLDDVHPPGTMRHFREIKGRSDMAIKYPTAFVFHIAIGNNEARERLSQLPDKKFVNIIHPESIQCMRQDCIGSFFAAKSYLGACSKVGNFTILNTNVSVDHDCEIGDFSHLAPGVVTGGRVKIGSRTTIGLSAVIRDGVTIGNNCVIGMGSVIIKDIPDNLIVWGTPGNLEHREKK